MPALAQLAKAVRDRQLPGKAQAVAAEDIHQSIVKRDPWADRIVIRFVSIQGVPYTFAVSAKGAIEIADQLKTEAAKNAPTGHA